MRNRIITCIFALEVLTLFYCTGQESFNKLYDYAKSFAAEMEKLGYEVVHLDFDILTSSDNKEYVKRSLYSDYEYAIAAYGDPDIFKSIRITLSESVNNEWKSIEEGQALNNWTNISAFHVLPDEDKNYLITIYADQFMSQEKEGRFFLFIGHKAGAIVINSYAQEDYKVNSKTGKEYPSNYRGTDSEFKIYLSKSEIEHKRAYVTDRYKLVKNATSEDDKDFITYQIQDKYGKKYAFQINLTRKTIIIVESSNRKNILVGKRYYFSGNF